MDTHALSLPLRFTQGPDPSGLLSEAKGQVTYCYQVKQHSVSKAAD